MSIVVDSSFTDSTTATQGFLTGLQKGTVYKSTSASSKATETPVSFYFEYSSDDTGNEQYGASVTTDSAISGLTTSLSSTGHLSSLSELILSGDSSSSVSTAKSASSTTSSSSGFSISSPRETNKKLSLLVGTMVGLSVLLTAL